MWAHGADLRCKSSLLLFMVTIVAGQGICQGDLMAKAAGPALFHAPHANVAIAPLHAEQRRYQTRAFMAVLAGQTVPCMDRNVKNHPAGPATFEDDRITVRDRQGGPPMEAEQDR